MCQPSRKSENHHDPKSGSFDFDVAAVLSSSVCTGTERATARSSYGGPRRGWNQTFHYGTLSRSTPGPHRTLPAHVEHAQVISGWPLPAFHSQPDEAMAAAWADPEGC